MVAVAALVAACGGGGDDACPPGSTRMGDACLPDDASVRVDAGDAGETEDAGDAGETVDAGDSGAMGDACSPSAEVCNGVDDDCDGMVDEGVTMTFYRDADGDGFGLEGMTMEACTMPPGYASMASDCDDACATCRPGGTETCDGRDNDCNGMIDEGVTMTFYLDADGDGFGLEGMTMEACTTPPGYATMAGDCDDACATCRPGGTEACDGRDNDCDGMIDEGVTNTYFLDADRDTYGVTGMTRAACAPTGDFVATRGGDCDDGNPAVNPGATEVCNGRDDNCNGTTDEGFMCIPGTTGVPCATTCGSTGTGTCTATCMPAPPTLCTPPLETCNDRDDDCDGIVDEGVARLGSATTLSVTSTFGLELVGTQSGYVAVWRDNNSALYAQRLTATGALAGARLTLLDGTSSATKVNAFAATYVPPVSAGSDAYVVVAWQQSADRDVYATRLNAATLATVTGATSLYDETALFVEMEAAATVNDLLIAYPRTDSVRLVRATTALGTPSMRDQPATGVTGTTWIALSAPRASRFLLAYTTTGGSAGITLQALDRFGFASGAAAPRSITGGASALSLTTGTVVPAISDVGVAYISGGRVFFQAASLDDSGVPAWVGGPVEIDSGAVTATRFLTGPDSLQVAFGSGRWMVAYLKSTATPPSASASRLMLGVAPAVTPLSFTLLSPDATTASLDQTDASLAASGTRAVVGSALTTSARAVPLGCY
jgi:hypothetical protein